MTFDYLAFSSFVPDAQELPRAGSTDQPGLDAENLEALRALGYVE